MNTSDIWTPEQLTPEGWDPDEWFEVNSWTPKRDETRVVQGVILHAAYYPDKETIAVRLRKEDGQEAISYLPKSAFKFGGKNYVDLPKDETDQQMEETAGLFIRAKGRKIKLRVYAS